MIKMIKKIFILLHTIKVPRCQGHGAKFDLRSHGGVKPVYVCAALLARHCKHVFFCWRKTLHRLLKPEGDLRKEYMVGDVFIEMFRPDEPGKFFHLAAVNAIDCTGSMQVLHEYCTTGFFRIVAATGSKDLQMAELDDEHPMGFMLVHKCLASVSFGGP